MSEGAFVPLEFPSWIRWGVRKGAILDQVEERGANGRGLCRWCRGEVRAGRQSWCSHACVAHFRRVWSWGALSLYVIERDGVCQSCQCEHPGWNRSRALERTAWRWPMEWPSADERGYYSRAHDLAPWWEVDHILPVKDGGTDDPANLRLLCHACHVAAGIEQRRARKAKSAPELQFNNVA